MNKFEVANLSAQMQEEVDSIQITGHQSHMSFRKRTHSKLNEDKALRASTKKAIAEATILL